MQKLVCFGLFLSMSFVTTLYAGPLDEAKVAACRKYMEQKGTQAHVLAFEKLVHSGCLKKVMDSVSSQRVGDEKPSDTNTDKNRLLKAAWLNEVRLLQDGEVSDAFNDLQYAGFLNELGKIILQSKVTTKKSSMDEIAQHLLDCMDLSNYKDAGKDKTQWNEVTSEQSDPCSEEAKKRYSQLRKLSDDEKATVRRKGLTEKKEQIIEVDALTNNAFGLGITQWSEHRYHFYFDEAGKFLHHKKQ